LTSCFAQELGRQLGGTLEDEVFIGTGANGRMKGFFAQAGTTSVNAVGASTFASTWGALMEARRQHHVAYGAPADMLVLHPRREVFFDFAGTLAAHFNYGIDRRVVSAEFPVNRGAGGTNGAALLFSTGEMALHSAPVQFQAAVDQTGSAALTVRYTAYQFAGLHVRAPLSVSHAGGTWATPTFP
jgi:hypothetical protein